MRLSEPTATILMKTDPCYHAIMYANDSSFWRYIRFTRIFAEVPWGGDVKRQWGRRQRQFSAFLLAIFSETLEMRPALLYSDTQSVVSFSVIPKCTALNDLEWLFRVKLCFAPAWLTATSKNNCVKTNKHRHMLYCQRRKSMQGL